MQEGNDAHSDREPLWAGEDPSAIPWADLVPDPLLMRWLVDHHCGCDAPGCRALKIGCGLGDDAEELARCGWHVTAIDASDTAVRWCRERFAGSPVEYVQADIGSQAPPSWEGAFELVVASQARPEALVALSEQAHRRVAGLVAPGGTLLILCRLRQPAEGAEAGGCAAAMDAVSALYTGLGLERAAVHEYVDPLDPTVRRGAIEFRAPDPR